MLGIPARRAASMPAHQPIDTESMFPGTNTHQWRTLVPAGASSTTMELAGCRSQPSGGGKEHLRIGLAERDVLGGNDGLEAGREADGGEHRVDVFARSGGCDSLKPAVGGEALGPMARAGQGFEAPFAD